MSELLELKTLGDLKTYGYVSKTIKQELRDNLISFLKEGKTVFEGIYGYEETVIPEVERAILSGHNINFLGLRGQAKTRMARKMILLLDQYIPVVEGSEINDDPFFPMSYYARKKVEELGDSTPIVWLKRDERFFEKLATPDVTVADLVGDIDPIKAANLKLSYNDERVIHYGMIPRANRCIFVINELPDLQARIQVSLFNILQENDLQIRGFKVRLPLDIQMVFTSNPEDYTQRGSIVTPLKDRIGSQILTHYPKTIEIAKKITSVEVQSRALDILVPEIAKDLIEMIGFEARQSNYVLTESGVSARMSITMMENLLSTAERRMLLNSEVISVVRLSDFMGVLPAITGKLELVYEGEQLGAKQVAETILLKAVQTLFNEKFQKIQKLKKLSEESVFDKVSSFFVAHGKRELSDLASGKDYEVFLKEIEPLAEVVKDFQPHAVEQELNFLKEILLWGLAEYKVVKKDRVSGSYFFDDPLGSFVSEI